VLLISPLSVLLFHRVLTYDLLSLQQFFEGFMHWRELMGLGLAWPSLDDAGPVLSACCHDSSHSYPEYLKLERDRAPSVLWENSILTCSSAYAVIT